MLIGICGGICAGKHTVAQYLVDHHGFTHLYLTPSYEKTEAPNSNSSAADDSEDASSLSAIQPGSLSLRPKPPSSKPEHIFSTPDSLLDFVTKRWQERWVTTDIYAESILDLFERRPFFILVSVDAPVSVRFQRFQARISPSESSTRITLSDFLLRSDTHLYSPTCGLLPLISRATVRLLNTTSDLAHLYATLGKLDLTNEDRLRPTWDQYFMRLASLAAQRSNCMKRRVGCVVVLQNRVVSTGYNGTPRGLKNCGEGGCARCNDGMGSGVGLGTCLCIHAEENALLEAGRERIREGTRLYCDTCPCLTCSIKIVQVRITEVIYAYGYSMDGETEKVFREAGVKLRQFIPPANGLIHLEKQALP